MNEAIALTRENFTLFFGGDKTEQPITERFAGLPVTMTESGQIVGYGHLTIAEFLPAAIHLYVTEGDGPGDESELISLGETVTHEWAVVSSYTNAEEWEISTEGITATTACAFPVTVLEA